MLVSSQHVDTFISKVLSTSFRRTFEICFVGVSIDRGYLFGGNFTSKMVAFSLQRTLAEQR